MKTARGSDALAKSISHGDGEKPKPQPGGVPLAPGSDVLDVDAPRTEPQQLQVAPITVLKSEYREQVVHQIVSNTSYICYGLKQGHIRVLNKETANRALLKGHTCMISDMRFYAATSNLLASCDQSGKVFVRKIFEGSPEAGIQEEILMSHSFDVGDLATRHLAWHPHMENMLAVLTRDRIAFVNVPPTSGLASSSDFAQPILPDEPTFTPGQNKLFTALAFSHQGDLLAASTSDGTVEVWAMPPDLASKQQFEPLPPTPHLSFTAFGGEHSGKAAACSMDFLPSHTPHSVLVVANPTASWLELWVVNHPEGSPMSAECTYKLQLHSSSQGPSAFFNHLLVQPNFSVVVLANTKGKQVYVLHAHQDAHSSHAVFDHLCLFEVRLPILSMSTLTEPGYEHGSPVQEFHLYCVQTEAIQQYTLHPSACFPPADLEEDEQRQKELAAEGKPEALGPAAVPEATPSVPPTIHIAAPPSEAPTKAAEAAPAAAAPQPPQPQQPQQPQQAAAAEGEQEVEAGAPPQSGQEPAAAAPTSDAAVPAEAAAPAPASTPAESTPAPAPASTPAAAQAPPAQVSSTPSPRPQGRTTEEMLADMLAKRRAMDAALAADAAAAAAATTNEEVRGENGAGEEVESDEDLRRAQEAGRKAQAAEQQQHNEQQQQQQQEGNVSISSAATFAPSRKREELVAQSEGVSATAANTTTTTAATILTERTARRAKSPTSSSSFKYPSSAAKRPRLEDSEDDTAASCPQAPDRWQSHHVNIDGHDDSSSSCSSSSAPPTAQQQPQQPQQQHTQGADGAGSASTSTTSTTANTPAPPMPKALLSRKARLAAAGTAGAAGAGGFDGTAGTAAPDQQPSIPAPPPSAVAPEPDTAALFAAAVAAANAEAAAPAPSGKAEHAPKQQASEPASTMANGPAAPPAAAQGGKVYEAAHVERLLASQQQMLTQLMNSHKESLKMLRAEHKAEMKTQAKVHEAAVKAAVESAMKVAEQREKESARVLGAMGRDLGTKVDALGRQLPNQVAASIRSALAEALPSVTQQAVDKALSTQLRNTLPKAVTDAVRENLASSVVPAFEKATQVIFGQMESAIKHSVTIHASPATKATTMLEQAHTQMGGLISSLRTEANSLRTETASMRAEGAAAGRSATAAAAAAAKAAAAATAASKAVAQSAAIAAPAPAAGPLALQAPPDPKVTIDELWAHGRFDEAFSTALESGGGVLEWLLHKAPPESVLGTEPCVLSPGVLLSLLTYLAHGVRSEPELKLRWIIEVAPCLDPKHPQAMPHTKTVLEPVKVILQMLAKESTGEVARTAKTAVHLVNSLLHQ